ncbi:MAG: hypothetical protein MUC83_07710 [Pirellula sp.]|jgi:hypothetical protein|nr:hypothetical protein [Pirellula sp.]
MTAAGFHHRNTSGLDMFVEHPDASARNAVFVLFVGRVERKGEEPNPDIEPWVRSSELRTISSESLVRMKLNAFRDKDRVHVRDMIAVGLIDESWLEKYPQPLRLRLSELLNDPDG